MPGGCTTQASARVGHAALEGVPAPAFDGDAALAAYFEERPVELRDCDRLCEAWMAFLAVADPASRNRLAALSGKQASELDVSDYPLCSARGRRNFADWLVETNETAFVLHDDPHAAPAWMLVEPCGAPLEPGTPILHFTDDARAIKSRGFLLGVPDPARIHLTREHSLYGGPPRRISYGRPGYNFGYLADGTVDMDLRAGGYGSQALLFPGTGLPVFHDGDGERQVVFWGPSAPASQGVAIVRGAGRWVSDTGASAKSLNALVRRLARRMNSQTAGRGGWQETDGLEDRVSQGTTLAR